MISKHARPAPVAPATLLLKIARQYKVRQSLLLDAILNRLSAAAATRAKRLARHYGITQLGMIELALADAERKVLQDMSPEDERVYLDDANR